jgi:hypothetical protein
MTEPLAPLLNVRTQLQQLQDEADRRLSVESQDPTVAVVVVACTAGETVAYTRAIAVIERELGMLP